MCTEYHDKTHACCNTFLEHCFTSSVLVPGVPDSGQTQGGHLCRTWAMKAFTKSKTDSKQTKKSISKQQKLPISTMSTTVPATLKSETGDG